MEWNINENNFLQLQQCAQELLIEIGNQALDTTILTLSGDLGAGKTALVQALATELGIMDVVTSPTFSIMKRYQPARQYESFVHIDAYRFVDEHESTPLHFAVIFTEPHILVCIEWPERIIKLLPPTAIQVTIAITTHGARRIVLTIPPH